MADSDFLAKIKLVLEGKEATVGGLKETQQAAGKLSSTKVTTTFDKEGLATGKQLQQTFKNVSEEAKKGSGFIGELGNAMRKALIVAPVWILMRSAIMGTMNALGALPAAAIAWEKEMAQIKRVGKGTAEEYQILSGRLLDLSKAFGISASTMGQGAALWAQQGKSLSEIVPLMETTIKLSLITGKTVSTSVEDITAIMKSYRVEASVTMGLLDKLVKVEQEHAITTDVLTDAMKTGGPVAAQYGVSFEKFLGVITATHVATRASGNQIGNAWKTIFARMTTTAIPAIQSIAKVPVYMDKAGKSTYQNTGTFRNLGNVLDEVMISMGSLSDTQKTTLAKSLAMQRTINYLLSAYQNWDEGIKATVESLDSFGTADKSVNILLGTTSSKAAQLQSAWSELGVTIINNGQIIRNTIDLLKSLVSGVNDITLAFHGMAGQELLTSAIAKEGLDEEIKYRSKQLGQLKSIKELQKLLSETKEFEMRIKEEPGLDEDQKNKILSSIKQRQQFIEETISKQPKIEVSELFLEATIKRGEELQKLRDKITTLATEAYKVSPEVNVGILSTAPLKELEDRVKSIKGIKPEFISGRKDELQNAVKYLEEIIKLRKEEIKMSGYDYLTTTEERLKNEKEFATITKEYQEDNKSLTTEQEAQLELERELSVYSIQRGVTEADILQKKIELLKVSQQFTNEQARTLELEKTQNQLISARLQKRKEEESSLLALSMQYEEADMFGRSRIRRTAELRMMNPKEISNAYQNTGYDKGIITENFAQFTKEQQDAIAMTTDLFKEMQRLIPEPITSITPSVAQQINYSGQMIFYSINADAIEKLAKMSPEEVIAYITSHPEAKQLIANIAANTNTR